MAAGRRFGALSLDLWFTTTYHLAEDEAAWDAAREEVLRERLRRPDGATFSPEEIAEATRIAGSRRRGPEQMPMTTDPAVVVRSVAAQLGAEIVGDPEAAARAYSAAGLARGPPRMNPQAEALVAGLADRGIPTVLLTNSARRSATWAEFFRERGGPPFRSVVSSCDFGAAKPDPSIFLAAARAVGVAADRLLHVGDRWELDVVGALAAGCGAALYRGLWDRYPPGLYEQLPPPPVDAPAEVRRVDDLRTLLAPELWRPGPSPTG